MSANMREMPGQLDWVLLHRACFASSVRCSETLHRHRAMRRWKLARWDKMARTSMTSTFTSRRTIPCSTAGRLAMPNKTEERQEASQQTTSGKVAHSMNLARSRL